ncbi:hypothetical protein KUCAC02_023145, partial [Chaenocephalus aceratus]
PCNPGDNPSHLFSETSVHGPRLYSGYVQLPCSALILKGLEDGMEAILGIAQGQWMPWPGDSYGPVWRCGVRRGLGGSPEGVSLLGRSASKRRKRYAGLVMELEAHTLYGVDSQCECRHRPNARRLSGLQYTLVSLINTPWGAVAGWLPGEFRYHVCQYEEVVSLGDHTGFEATLRLDVHTVEQVKEWVQKLKGSSGVTWRVDVTRPRLGKRVLFKASYKCQHRVNPRAAKSSKKHLLSSKNAHDTQEYSWGNEVILINRHNHNRFVADAIRHQDVGEKVNSLLTGLFEIGHTPTSALAVLKHDLQMEYGQRYVYVSANREICPDLPYVQRLFHKVCREEYGTQTGPTMLAALKLQVEIYNNKCNDTCALLGTTSQGAPLVVVCSPLMKKVHQLKHSGELCFIDSSGNMDRENCRVFLLLTHSCAGGLPLGILLCQSEDEQTIAQGLEQLKQVVGEKGFAGRGHEGPQLVITDDCRAERGALGKAFPKATLLLCSFHLLQAVWRWLWSKESEVTHGERPALFAIVKEMLYCQEIGRVDRLYSEARGHPVAARNKKQHYGLKTYCRNLSTKLNKQY